MNVEVNITMSPAGEITVKGNVTGPHLIGTLELAKAATMKGMIGNASSKSEIVPKPVDQKEG